MDYWTRKSKRTSPTGLGSISSHADSKMPMYGVGGLDQRIGNAVDMGGMQQKVVLRLGKLVIHERPQGIEPYDGEIWSWSPAELNRIAYVDGGGALWVASADGTRCGPFAQGRLHAPGVVGRRQSDRRGRAQGRRPPLGHQHHPAAAGVAYPAMTARLE